MGSDEGNLNERPAHEAEVDGFWMDRHEVTNSEFGAFVSATGYITVAEQRPTAIPGVPEKQFAAGAIVFHAPRQPAPWSDYRRWWRYVAGANWRHPEGPNSSIKVRKQHPVVNVAYDDAMAFCTWAGKTLPTEAEWEFAGNGGMDHAGTSPTRQMNSPAPAANTWQGRFPDHNTLADGYRTTAPVCSFPPNGFGLCDMAGNVWEWTRDHYFGRTDSARGDAEEADPLEVTERVIKGGSFLCSESYCSGFRPSARVASEEDAAQYHVGFRCIATITSMPTPAPRQLAGISPDISGAPDVSRGPRPKNLSSHSPRNNQ